MAIAVLALRQKAVELLNESDPDSSYGAITGERYKSGELDVSLLLAAATIVRAICNLKGHGRRADYFTTQNNVQSGAALASMVGPVETVQFAVTGGAYAGTQPGIEMPISYLDELLQENRNPQGVDIEPRYVQEGNTLYHTAAGMLLAGASQVIVNVRHCQFTLDLAATEAPIPGEFARACAAGSLEMELMKDGHKIGAGNAFGQIWGREMSLLGIADAPPPGEAG